MSVGPPSDAVYPIAGRFHLRNFYKAETVRRPRVPRACKTGRMKNALRPAIATLTLTLSALNGQNVDPLPKPEVPAARDPFLKNRGAPASAPKTADKIMTVSVIFETYAMGMDDAVGLLLSPPDSAARYRHVNELVKGGAARLENLIASASKPGRRALVESMDSISRPNGWSAPDTLDEPAVGAVMQQWGLWDRIEFEAIPGDDGRSSQLNFSIGASRLLGLRGFRAGPKVVPQPSFTTEIRSLTTSVALRTGEPILLGTLNRPLNAQPEKKEWSVVFARVILSKERPEAPPPEVTALSYCEHVVSVYSMEMTAARDVLASEHKLGGSHAAVLALLEKKEAKLEQIVSTLSQPGMRARTDGGMLSRQLGSIIPVPASRNDGSKQAPEVFLAKNETAAAAPYFRTVANRELGLTLEVESVIGPADALLKGIPVIVDINLSLGWRANVGLLKGTDAIPIQPETGVEEQHTLDNSISCYAGVTTLLGTLNPPRETGVNNRKDSGRIWLAFIRVIPAKQ